MLLDHILRCENVVVLDILARSVRAIVMRTLNVKLVSSVEIIIADSSVWRLTLVWTVVLLYSLQASYINIYQ